MDITKEEREELKALSKDIFGTSSKWHRMFSGVQELVTKKVTETIPGENGAPDTTKEVVVPVLLPNGAKQYRTKVYTFEEIKENLLRLKKQRDEYFAKLEADKKMVELNKVVKENASGTVDL